MSTYILCKNKAERDAVLKAMDRKGIRWICGGEMPSTWESDDWGDDDSVYLIARTDNSLSWAFSTFNYNGSNDAMLSASEYLAKNNKCYPILIYRKGRAVYAEDKGTEEVGTAICSPDDKFDFRTGAMIALCRLIGDEVGDDAKTEMRKLLGDLDTDDFKVGDRIEIKSWDAMEKEYGTAKWGEISHGGTCFCGSMKHLCGRTATITAIDDERYSLDFDDKSGDVRWYYTDWMFKKSDKPKPEVTEIKVGDVVKVVNDGACYSMYDTWVKDNVTNINDCIHYCYKKNIPAEKCHRYTVIAIGPHDIDSKKTLYYIKNIATEECFLMEKRGIEKV